jgi:apolipoprotein N-acyltransferase
MIRDHFARRTNAPQPQLLIAGVIWLIALLCLYDGSRPKWAWAMIGVAALLSVYVAVRFWLYYGAPRKTK